MNNSVPTSPVTPIYPTAQTSYIQRYTEYKQNEEISSIFKDNGFQNPTKIADTLQGSIWRAFVNQQHDIKPVIVKITNKSLHQCSRAIVNDEEYRVCEDILKECTILKHVTKQKDCPDSIVKYDGFFASNQHLCLLMEDGGGSLFDFVDKAHQCIRSGHMDLYEWNKALKIIFKQMLESVSYIHSHNVAHFDISLENFLINEVEVEVDECEDGSTRMRFVCDDIHVKLCDFGLAEKFESKPCLSNKFCGKGPYKSPEIVYKQKGFDALQNDVWCLGICWLTMAIGATPWNRAHESDNVFSFFLAHSVTELLEYWNVSKCVDPRIIYLFEQIFQDEEHRMSISEINKYLYQFVFD